MLPVYRQCAEWFNLNYVLQKNKMEISNPAFFADMYIIDDNCMNASMFLYFCIPRGDGR